MRTPEQGAHTTERFASMSDARARFRELAAQGEAVRQQEQAELQRKEEERRKKAQGGVSKIGTTKGQIKAFATAFEVRKNKKAKQFSILYFILIPLFSNLREKYSICLQAIADGDDVEITVRPGGWSEANTTSGEFFFLSISSLVLLSHL